MAQQYYHPQWVHNMHGSVDPEINHHLFTFEGIALHDEQITALIGMFPGIINFDPEGGEEGLIDNTEGHPQRRKLFLLRYNTDGSFLGKRQISSNDTEGRIAHVDAHMDVDGNGNIFVTQMFHGTIQVAPEEDSGYIDSLFNPVEGIPASSAYVAKYDYQGNLEWVKVVASNVDNVLSFYSRAIKVAPDGSIYLAIAFRQDIFIHQGDESILLEGRTGDDAPFSNVALIKLNPEGNVEWFKGIAGDHAAPIGVNIAIETDAQNNVYLVSGFAGTADLNPDEPGEITHPAVHHFGAGIYWVKFSPEGEFLAGDAFSRTTSSVIGVRGFKVSEEGNVYLGILSRPIYILSQDEIFEPPVNSSSYRQVLKYNSAGEFLSLTYNILRPQIFIPETTDGLNLAGRHYVFFNNEYYDFNPNGEEPITFEELDGHYFFLTRMDADLIVNSVHPLFKIQGELSPFYAKLLNENDLFIMGRVPANTIIYPGIQPVDGQSFEYPGLMIGLFSSQEPVNSEDNLIRQLHDSTPLLYPNPVTSKVVLEFPPSVEFASMEVFNTSGQLVFNGNGHPDFLANLLNSKLPGMETGVYFIRVSDENQWVRTLKMLKK